MLLDLGSGDILLDSSGNIAIATGPYALAQDAASACKLFLGEQFLNVLLGVPYLPSILGTEVPLSLVKAKLVTAALTVPGVATAEVFITSFQNRTLQGQIQITSADTGQVAVAPLVSNFNSDFSSEDFG